jgi:hypothetical protein
MEISSEPRTGASSVQQRAFVIPLARGEVVNIRFVIIELSRRWRERGTRSTAAIELDHGIRRFEPLAGCAGDLSYHVGSRP